MSEAETLNFFAFLEEDSLLPKISGILQFLYCFGNVNRPLYPAMLDQLSTPAFLTSSKSLYWHTFITPLAQAMHPIVHEGCARLGKRSKLLAVQQHFS